MPTEPRPGFPLPVEGGPFGGEHATAYNALWLALHRAAALAGHNGEYGVYDFLEHTPRTSLVVEVTDELRRMGYDIAPLRARRS